MFQKLRKAYTQIKKGLANHQKIDNLDHYLSYSYKSAKVNLGQMQAAANSQKKKISRLSEVEFQVFSQFGDDGIIQWLVQQLPLPNKTFIEFGVENYKEANTRFLLVNNYWSGLVMDGSSENMLKLKSEFVYVFYDVQAISSFITKDNINSLIAKTGFKKEIGLLSIDIDGNDYWVWQAISEIEPVIIICEYNSLFGFKHPFTIQYQDDFVRGRQYPFNFYGISLRSACDMAAERGYSFIGCNSAGNNSYFIKNNYLQHLGINPITAEEGYVFASFSEAYNEKEKDWYRGADKVRSINGQPVYNTQTKQVEKLNAQEIIDSLNEANKLKRF